MSRKCFVKRHLTRPSDRLKAYKRMRWLLLVFAGAEVVSRRPHVPYNESVPACLAPEQLSPLSEESLWRWAAEVLESLGDVGEKKMLRALKTRVAAKSNGEFLRSARTVECLTRGCATREEGLSKAGIMLLRHAVALQWGENLLFSGKLDEKTRHSVHDPLAVMSAYMSGWEKELNATEAAVKNYRETQQKKGRQRQLRRKRSSGRMKVQRNDQNNVLFYRVDKAFDAKTREKVIDETLLPLDGVLFAAMGKAFIKLSLCNAGKSKAAFTQAKLGTAIVVPGFEEVLTKNELQRTQTVDLMLSVSWFEPGINNRILKVAAFLYSPFRRFTLFCDNDVVFNAAAGSLLRTVFETFERSNAHVAAQYVRSSAKRDDTNLREFCPYERAWNGETGYLHADALRHLDHRTEPSPWAGVFQEVNSGVVLFKDSTHMRLLINRWLHFLTTPLVYTHGRDQPALMIALEEVLPAFVELSDIAFEDPRNCCGKCRKYNNLTDDQDTSVCGCICCHENQHKSC